MNDLTKHCEAQLQALDEAHARRTLRAVPEGMISFAGNDYLGLGQHPQVLEVTRNVEAAGAGASRLVTGNHAHYAPLECQLAAMKNKPAALVFGSGYLANIGTIAALMGEGDLILADKLAHACILDGAKLSGATLKRFKHNDVAHAESLLATRGEYKKLLIVTEHIFSMDGDRAPLVELAILAKKYDGWLMVDDAHGLFETPSIEADLWMGTLSKAAGSYGGYVAAAQPVIDYLTTSARSFIFSTGLPPAICAGARSALQIIEAEPERRTRVLAHAQRFTDALGLAPAQSAIVPLILGSNEAALRASENLQAQGIFAAAIRPPTVPANTARLRLSFSAAHSDSDVDALIAALKQERVAA